VQNVIDATGKNQNNPNVAAQAQNPYLELAGLMDRRQSTLPEYAQYGRMGEQKFTNDLVGKLNAAVAADPTLKSDPTRAYNTVIAPWVNSMGSGYSNVGSTYAATNQGLLQDMTNQYLSGNAAQDWKAVGGDSPFANIYQNSPVQAAGQTSAASALPDNTPVTMRENPRPMMMRAAKGGKIPKDMQSRLDALYKSTYKTRHYDDGGGVDYFTPSVSDYGLIAPDYSPQAPNTSQFVLPQDPSQLQTPYGGDLNQYNSPEGQAPTDINNQNPSGSILGQGGALSGLGSLLGVNSMGQLLQQYGALAPLLAAAIGGNKPASAPAQPGGFANIAPIPTPSYSRPYTQPNVANWYTYGEGPEQSFFGNNQLPTIPGMSPGTGTPGNPTQPSSGGVGNQMLPYAGTQPMPILRAEGGSTFDSSQGHDYVPDPGHGDGTSDDIDAKLSGGEYVMDAGTVSMLGNGSNDAGARALDQLRERIRKHAGKSLSKGKQFMKAKPAHSYLKAGNE
jgi:hypothetical protein